MTEYKKGDKVVGGRMKTREEILKEYMPGDYDEIQGILNTPTQAQLDCQYCYGMNLEDYHKLLEENRTDDSSYIEKVKYCEVCGRKLGDE